jgi:hypothetical protein
MQGQPETQPPSMPARMMDEHATGTAMPAAKPHTDMPQRTMTETAGESAAGMDVTTDVDSGMPDRSMHEPVSAEMPEPEMETR